MFEGDLTNMGEVFFIQTVDLEMFILSDFTVSHLLSVYLSL